MIKAKGNIDNAINELKNNKNNAVAFVYENASFGFGKLSNATVTLKDLFATSDAPTQASSQILRGFEPGYDATIVKKLRESGAAIVGKMHMDELALGGTGQFSSFGLIHNSIDQTRMSGGSSSGSAVTLTENISIAIGSDTGDSVRLPASYNGLVGFKPSYGAVSRYGMFSFASSLDTVGWFSHNVSDAITTSQVLYGLDENDMNTVSIEIPEIIDIKPKKIAILNDYGKLPNYVKNELDKISKKIKDNGILVEEVSVDEDLLNAISIVYDVIAFSQASSNDANLTGINFGNRDIGKNWEEIILNSRSKGFGKMVQRRFTLGAFFLSTKNQEKYYNKARKVRRLIVDAFNKIYNEYDLLIFPSASIAPKIYDGKPEDWTSTFLTHSNFTGNPSISIPWIQQDGMPIGLNLNSKLYNDKQLLSFALYFEKIILRRDNE